MPGAPPTRMGSSYTKFQGYGFWARDSSLEVWLYLLARESGTVPGQPAWLTAAEKDWHLKATVGFNGCIDANLDQHVSSLAHRELILRLSRQVLSWLDRQGPIMPASVLNSFEMGGWSRDVETANFVRVGEAFVQLLEGNLHTDEKTSPVLP